MTEMMSELNVALGISETDWCNCKRLIIASYSFNKHKGDKVLSGTIIAQNIKALQGALQ